MSVSGCHAIRPRLLESAGAPAGTDRALLEAHCAACAPCREFAQALRADAALLGAVLRASAPPGPPPRRGTRRLRSLALAEGRALPAWWLAVPAAAAAVLLAVGLWSTTRPTPAPRVAGVRVELVAGPEWQGVVAVAADRQSSGPVGPLVDRVLEGMDAGEGRR